MSKQSKGTYYECGLIDFLNKANGGGRYAVDVQFSKSTSNSSICFTITARVDRSWKNWIVEINE